MIRHGDLFDVLPTIADESIDASVTDPPYGIGFMGREWDTFKPTSIRSAAAMKQRKDPEQLANLKNVYGRKRSPAQSPSQIGYDYSAAGLRGFQEWTESWAREVFRVLKPGAYILVCGAPRSYHRMACGLEDAGFELRDSIDFLLSVEPMFAALWASLAIDQQEILARVLASYDGHLSWVFGSGFPKSLNFEGGLGTALKPAHEPIVVARKPFKATVASNLAAFGTGALNIDACRIGGGAGGYRGDEPSAKRRYSEHGGTNFAMTPGPRGGDAAGRWPANVILDDETAVMLDEMSGELVSGANPTRRGGDKFRGVYGAFDGQTECDQARGVDVGGASRFFYVAKPSRSERDAGCYDLPECSGGESTHRKDGSAGLRSPRAGAGRTGGSANIHPTVKPVELMRWLVRLVTPPGGTVIDPFTGSGTTGMACVYEQREFIGIEREAEYVEIAKRRIASVAPLFTEVSA